MAEYDELLDILKHLLFNRFSPQASYTRGLLGDGLGNVQVPGRPDKSYVRFNRGSSEYFEIFNRTVNPVHDWPVLIGELPWQPGLTQVVDTDWSAFEQSGWGDSLGDTSPHAPTHEWPDGSPGSDVVDTYLRSIVPLRGYSLTGTAFYANSLEYEYQGSGHVWGGLPGIDLSPVMSDTVTGTMRYAGVYLDPANNGLLVMTGSTTVHSSAIEPPLVSFPQGVVPVARVRIYGSQTRLNEADIRDARRLFDPVNYSTGTSSGSGAWPYDNILTVSQTNPAADYSTIASAITGASNGDIILLDSGTYTLTAPLDTGNKNITIMGLGAPAETVIGMSTGGTYLITNTGGGNLNLRNLRMVLAVSNPGGVINTIYQVGGVMILNNIVAVANGGSATTGAYGYHLDSTSSVCTATVRGGSVLEGNRGGVGVVGEGIHTTITNPSTIAVIESTCAGTTTDINNAAGATVVLSNAKLLNGTTSGTVSGTTVDPTGAFRALTTLQLLTGATINDITTTLANPGDDTTLVTEAAIRTAITAAAGGSNVWADADKVNIGTTEYATWALANAALGAGDQAIVGEGSYTSAAESIADGADVRGSGMDVSVLTSNAADPITLNDGTNILQDLTVECTLTTGGRAILIGNAGGADATFINVKAVSTATSGTARGFNFFDSDGKLYNCVGEASGGATNRALYCYDNGSTTTVEVFGGEFTGDVVADQAGMTLKLYGPKITGSVTALNSATITGYYIDSNGKMRDASDGSLINAKLVASDGSPDPAWYTDASGHLYGALGLKLRAYRESAIASTMYTNGNIEALASAAGGGYPAIGWYRSGTAGAAVYLKSRRADETLRVIDSAGVDWPIARHHGVGVYRNATQAIAATTFTTVVWTGSWQNDGTNLPVYWDTSSALYGYAAGWYIFNSRIYATGVSTVGIQRPLINGAASGINPGRADLRETGGFVSNIYYHEYTKLVYLTYGQYIQLQVYFDAASTLGADLCQMSLVYLGS